MPVDRPRRGPALRELATIGVLVLHGASAHAADQPLQELFQSEVVYPQEAHETQVTVATRLRREHGATVFEIPLVLEYGLTDAWQVGLEWVAFVHRDAHGEAAEQGVGDLEIGTKYSLMDESRRGFHQAFGLDIGLPVGDEDRELGEGVVEYEPFVIVAQDVRAGAQVFTQVGLALVQRVRSADDADDHQLFVNVGGFAAFDEWVATAELNWRTELRSPGTENELYATPGVVRHVAEGWEAGIGVPVGLTAESDRVRVITQLTFEF